MPRTQKYEVWRDRGGQWRWTLKSSNGRVLADSAEGYRKRSEVRAAVQKIIDGATTVQVVERAE